MTELSHLQQIVLDEFKKSSLKERFYWTGGTLLSVVYLHHRHSEDIDFFSDEPFSHDTVVGFVRDLEKETSLEFIEEKKVFDRWEFFLHNREEVRLEFVHYDHPKIKEREYWNGIMIDSLHDIAANKTMALVDRNEPKDAVDIYFLLTQANFSMRQLLQFVEKKFGVKLQESTIWGEALQKAKDISRITPLLIGKEESQKEIAEKIQEYFRLQSKQFLDRELT